MANLSKEAAFMTLMDQELDSARMMLEGPGRKVFGVGVSVSEDQGDDGFEIHLHRSVSEHTTRPHGVAYTIALEREIARVKGLMK